MGAQDNSSPSFSLANQYELLRQLNRRTPDFDQNQAIDRLIWYLNSGGRRSYIVVERPDNAERNSPRADYVCKDEVTGAFVTVEVTKIFHNPQIRKIDEFRRLFWYEIARLTDGQLPGTFILGLPAKIRINQRKRASVADNIVASLTKFAVEMKIFEIRRLPYRFSLFKMSDHGTALLGPVVSDDREDDLTAIMSSDQIVEAIERPLHEAVGKLSAYARGVKAVLLDCQFFVGYTEVHDTIEEIDWGKYKAIDRLYILNVGYRGQMIRVW